MLIKLGELFWKAKGFERIKIVNMVYKQMEKQVYVKTKKLIHLIEQRGHCYLRGQYKHRQSILIVSCALHRHTYVTTFYNYERSVIGCLCCSHDRVRSKSKNRALSQKTRSKMSKSALTRPNRKGKPFRWRNTSAYAKWRKVVLQNYNNQCAITGLVNTKNNFLEVHHFYNAKNYPHLVYNIKNGIVLTKEMHILFHKQYGYSFTTLDQFCDFLLFLHRTTKPTPISSQGGLENSQGSETRAYDPERIMKLHERLKKLELNL